MKQKRGKQPVPIGSIRFDNIEGRAFIKISSDPHIWIRRSHFVWQQVTGKQVPIGYHVHHIDENKTNDDFSNLELLTNSEHVRRHKIGNQNTKGRKATEEQCKYLSKIGKGRKLSEEHKKKISLRMLGNKFGIGRINTEEARKKISAYHKGRPKSEEHKKKLSEAAKNRKKKNKSEHNHVS